MIQSGTQASHLLCCTACHQGIHSKVCLCSPHVAGTSKMDRRWQLEPLTMLISCNLCRQCSQHPKQVALLQQQSLTSRTGTDGWSAVCPQWPRTTSFGGPIKIQAPDQHCQQAAYCTSSWTTQHNALEDIWHIQISARAVLDPTVIMQTQSPGIRTWALLCRGHC